MLNIYNILWIMYYKYNLPSHTIPVQHSFHLCSTQLADQEGPLCWAGTVRWEQSRRTDSLWLGHFYNQVFTSSSTSKKGFWKARGILDSLNSPNLVHLSTPRINYLKLYNWQLREQQFLKESQTRTAVKFSKFFLCPLQNENMTIIAL